MRWVMRLQEFDLDIQHRTGQRSGNVDGLTRQCPQTTQPYGEDKVEDLYRTAREYTALVATRGQKKRILEQENQPREGTA